jgi:hypothetical protein
MAELILNQLGAQLMTSEQSFQSLRVFARSPASLGLAQAELVRVASLTSGGVAAAQDEVRGQFLLCRPPWHTPRVIMTGA